MFSSSASAASNRLLAGTVRGGSRRLLHSRMTGRATSPPHDPILARVQRKTDAPRPLGHSRPGRCHMSTAAAAFEQDAVKPARRRRLETKDPIVVTERAANRIKDILSGETAKGALGIRLGVKRRGCNGLSYTLNYAFEKPEKDLEMESNGVTVFIEPMAMFSVVGTTMDWEETELSSEFTFNNPNSKGECGCGESFTV